MLIFFITKINYDWELNKYTVYGINNNLKDIFSEDLSIIWFLFISMF